MMSTEMKMLRAWRFLLCLGVLVWAAPPLALGQETPADMTVQADEAETGTAGGGGEAGAGGDPGAAEDAVVEEAPTEAASDAKRVVRIRKVIELDKHRLRWLRSELRARTRWFEELAIGMEEVATERLELRQQLEEMEADAEADATEVDALRAKLAELDETFELFDTQTDLALNAEKTVSKQLEAMEIKIERDELALGRLTGELKVEIPTQAEAAPTMPSEPKESGSPAPTPLPLPTAAPAPQRPATEKKVSSTMTAAQLQAQRELARKEREVELAKLELSDFIGRKRALQRQIEFEEELAISDKKERENLLKARVAFEVRVEKAREAGASAEKLERYERGNRELERVIGELEKAGVKRSEYIGSLKDRLANLEEAQLRVTAGVDEAHEAAEKARRHVMWLESPIHPRNVAHWATERGPRILLVIVVAIALMLLVQLTARRVARTVVRRRRGDRSEGTGRADTLAFSFSSASRVLIAVFGVLLVLQEAGIDIKTVLGGAAILGVALAFGAQDLMKDYFSGFLILLEDQYQLGDLVTIGGVTGTVESVNMRVTVLRDLEGRVHFVPNGGIDHVTNRTYAWGRPVFEVPVGYDEDVDRVMEVLVDVARELANDPDWKGKIIGEPDMLGVDKFTDYGVVIKFMVKTQPDQLFPVRRQMLRRITKRFIEEDIKITVPQRIIVRDEGGREV
jgi:small conductance mechanosensitive channel